MKSETKKLFARLKVLSSAAGTNVYERVSLAAQCMKDHDWIVELHQGDDFKAREALESEFFADLAGYVPLPLLLNILGAFPDESTWREYRYDLKAMQLQYEASRAPASTPKIFRQRATLADLQAKDEEITRLQKQLKKLRTENEKLKAELATFKTAAA